MDSPFEGLVNTGAIKLHVRRAGAGPPLLFLGGSNTDMRIRAPVFDSALMQYFDVVTYEPRGLGRSDHPEGEWSMVDYATDALSVIDSLGWDAPDVIGESFGAMTALELVVRHPERVSRLALVVGAAGGAGGSSFPIELFLSLPEPQQSIEALQLQDTRFQPESATDDAATAQRIEDRQAFNRAFLGCPQNASGYPRLLAARGRHDCWDRLPEIQAPTLVLSGRHDKQAPMEFGEALSERILRGHFKVIDGGHDLCFNHPDALNYIFSQWGVAEEPLRG